MAAKKLPPYVIFLMLFAILALAVAALRPVVDELRLVWKLRSPEDSEWRHAANLLIERGSRSSLVRAIEAALDRDTEDFVAWQTKLFDLRPGAVRWALPAYEAGLRHEKPAVRKASLRALLNGKWRRAEAVPVVVRALESPDPVIRWQAGYVLFTMGPGAAGAVPALVRAASDPDESVRWAAVYALGVMTPAAPEAVPALVQALGDPSALVASHAAGALGGFGRRAAPAVHALVETFRKGDLAVKVEAARALGALGRTAREALPVLLAALNDDRNWQYLPFGYTSMSDANGEVLRDTPPVSRDLLDEGPLDGRVEILEAVLRLGVDAGEVLPCLSKLVRDHRYGTRQAAAKALGRIGPAALAAIPDLVRSLADKEPDSRWSSPFTSETNHAAADALGAIGLQAVPALVEALRSGESRTRYGAARALAKMDRADAGTIEALRSALSDPRFTVIIAAARGLKRFEPSADVVPALLHAAARGTPDDEYGWHQESLDDLAGKEALPSLPLLREALSKADPILVCVAVRLLASMAGEAVEPLRDLLVALETGDRLLRQHAVEALGGLASGAEEVVPCLLRILESDPLPDIRSTAALSLQEFGARAGSALPALWARYADGKSEDRSRCLAIITAISPGDPRVIDLLLPEARGNWEVSAVLDLIAKAGPTARSFLPAAEQHLEHESIAIRLEAAEALWAVDRRVEPVLAIARGALADDWSSGKWSPYLTLYPPGFGSEWRNPVRENAARLLSEMGPAGKPAAPELVRCLDFPGATVRVLAAGALWRTAGDARLDVLIDAVDDSVPDLSSDPARMDEFTVEALRILGDMGPEARVAIPSLERLRDAAPAGPLRAAADEALRKVAQPRA